MGVCQTSSNQYPTQNNHSASHETYVAPNSNMTKFPTENDAESLFKRMVIILSDYYKLTSANNENNDLSNIDWNILFGSNTKYSHINLVNDFNVILDIFNDDEDIEKLHDALALKTPFNILNDAKNEQSILFRHLMKNQTNLSKLYFGCNELSDIAMFKLLDRMFFHIAYAHDLGLRLTENEIFAVSASVNDEEEKEKEPNNDGIDAKLDKMNKILANKHKLCKEINYFSDDANDKFTTNDEMMMTQFEKKNKKKSEMITYEIGHRYYYDDWKYYAQNAQKLGICEESIIKGHKYENIKEEMMENEILTQEQWSLAEIICQKYYFESAKCKKMRCDILKSDGHGIDIHYGLKQGDSICLEHIISIYLYCNYTNIKQKYQINDNKYAHFGRFLRECIECFGVCVFSDEAKDEWYHNIVYSQTYFDGHLALKWCNPSLMTSASNVICLYNLQQNQNDEMITLKLEKYTNDDCVNYFECNWLSHYSLDDECLFVGGKYALKLTSIIMKNVYNFEYYLCAMHILAQLIKGKANSIKFDEKILFAIDHLIKTKIEKQSVNVSSQGSRTDILMNEEKETEEETSENGDENENVFLMGLFSKFCLNVCMPIYINLIWICDDSKNGFCKLKHWIVNEDCSWIRFDVLCKLFPNVEKIKVGHSQFCLNYSTFESFFEFFEDESTKQYKLNEIVIEDPNEVNVSVKIVVNKYESKLNKIGWKIESNKYFTKIYLTKKSENNMWDDLF